MRYHLVGHHRLLSDPERYDPWREALARHQIVLAGVYDLTQPDWHRQLARAFVEGDRVLALGGDGTQSSVAHHCVEQGWPLAILPAGTANDFARALAIPSQPDELCSQLNQAQLVRIDVGRLNERVFLNVSHIGLGAEVALSVQPHKQRWGPLSYLRRLVQLIAGRRRFRARIEADGKVFYGRWMEIAVANGPYFGGGHLIDGAGFDTAALTLVAVKARPIPKVLLAWVMARLGRPLDRRLLRIEHIRQCRVQTRHRLKVTADGERFGRSPVNYRIEPQALQLVLPYTQGNPRGLNLAAAIEPQEERVLDQQHDVMLYSISGRGVELAERYCDLAGTDLLDELVSDELKEVAKQRKQLMDELRQEILDEGGLPKAGNPDREFFESLADRWLSSLSGPKAALERLRDADQQWLDDIVEVAKETWPEPLAELLISLSRHGHDCVERLDQLIGHY
ncbi:diacylglycerol/lipid kinase family protein [Motiliproteus coralliicola]|uniref:diacylglycerol/lipid kinase family protein n=1 Tax=Motiliproteus coralliicola TaxID=2283196 RepID=UPI0014031FBC|nr:diacylglycerol kinase family protein [Motiliproteus coralliicola]